MSDSKLPSNWVKNVSKTNNKSYFFNKATGQSVWSQSEITSSPSVRSTNLSKSSLNKLNPGSLVIKKSPAQDRLKRIQQELIDKQLANQNTITSSITGPNDAKSTHRSASAKSATIQSKWSYTQKIAAKHSSWDPNTTNSTPSNPELTKANSSSIPIPKNTKTSAATSKQDSINLSRNIKQPLNNRLKLTKIPKISDKTLPNIANIANEPQTGNDNQNDRKRKADNLQQAFQMRLIAEPKTKLNCARESDTIDSNIDSAIFQTKVSSISPSLPEAAALSNQNIKKTKSTVEVNITKVGQKSALSKNGSIQQTPTLCNAVLPTRSAAPMTETTQQTPSPKSISTPVTLPDSISNCDAAQRLESPSIFTGFFSGLKTLWGATAKTSEPAITNNDTLLKLISSRRLNSENTSENGILNSSKKELSAIQQRLQLDKQVIPSFEDHNPLSIPRINNPLDDVDVEMTDDDDMTSDSNESMEWENEQNEVVKVSNKTVESAKVPVPETQPKPEPPPKLEPNIQTPSKPLDIISSNASKRTSGLSLVGQRLLMYKSPEPRIIPDKVPIREYSPPPSNSTKRKLTIKPGETILIVIDTNVFLNSLSFVKNLVGQRQELKGNPTLMVPYQVLQELDNIKDCSKKNETIKSLAMGSIKYLEKYLQDRDECVQAQSAQDNQRNIVDIGSPDDRILNCCLQCQSLESKHIVLLSNDINLRNKALCSKVTAFSMAQLAEELNIK